MRPTRFSSSMLIFTDDVLQFRDEVWVLTGQVEEWSYCNITIRPYMEGLIWTSVRGLLWKYMEDLIVIYEEHNSTRSHKWRVWVAFTRRTFLTSSRNRSAVAWHMINLTHFLSAVRCKICTRAIQKPLGAHKTISEDNRRRMPTTACVYWYSVNKIHSNSLNCLST